MYKSLKSKLIFLIVFIIFNMIFSCFGNNIDKNISYILNIRSKKIHSIDCGIGKNISDKYKVISIETLDDLKKAGYDVCKKCNAQLKSERNIGTIIASLFGINDDENELNDIGFTFTYNEYLNAIDTMGVWYINNIPTYQKELQVYDIKASDSLIKKINLRIIDDNTSKNFEYIEDHSNIDLNANTYNVLRACKNAIFNYKKMFDKLEHSGIAFYPCELIGNYSDKNKKAGDDCVRFLFAILNSLDNNFSDKYKLLSNINCTRTSSNDLSGYNQNIIKALNKLGFTIYDDMYRSFDIDNDGIPDAKIEAFDSSFKLRKGDILVRKGHVHVYLGDGNSIYANNFGWGRVNNVYPWNTRIWYDISKKCIKLIDSAGKEDFYGRVIRYGGVNNEQ